MGLSKRKTRRYQAFASPLLASAEIPSLAWFTQQVAPRRKVRARADGFAMPPSNVAVVDAGSGGGGMSPQFITRKIPAYYQQTTQVFDFPVAPDPGLGWMVQQDQPARKAVRPESLFVLPPDSEQTDALSWLVQQPDKRKTPQWRKDAFASPFLESAAEGTPDLGWLTQSQEYRPKPKPRRDAYAAPFLETPAYDSTNIEWFVQPDVKTPKPKPRTSTFAAPFTESAAAPDPGSGSGGMSPQFITRKVPAYYQQTTQVFDVSAPAVDSLGWLLQPDTKIRKLSRTPSVYAAPFMESAVYDSTNIEWFVQQQERARKPKPRTSTFAAPFSEVAAVPDSLGWLIQPQPDLWEKVMAPTVFVRPETEIAAYSSTNIEWLIQQQERARKPKPRESTFASPFTESAAAPPDLGWLVQPEVKLQKPKPRESTFASPLAESAAAPPDLGWLVQPEVKPRKPKPRRDAFAAPFTEPYTSTNLDWLVPPVVKMPKPKPRSSTFAAPFLTTPVYTSTNIEWFLQPVVWKPKPKPRVATFAAPFLTGAGILPIEPPEEVCLVAKIDVWNTAAMALGLPLLQNVDEESPLAASFRAVWNVVRRRIFADFEWACVKKTRILSQLTEVPVGRYALKYALPYDYIRALSVNGEQVTIGDDRWHIETSPDGTAMELLCDASEVKLEYLADFCEIGHIEPHVLSALGFMLAARVAPLHGRGGPREAQLYALADAELARAATLRKQTGTPKQFRDTDSLRRRFT